MAAVAETFIPCMGATLTVDSVSLTILDGTIKESVEVDDFTNNLGGGWGEDLGTVRRLTFDLTVAQVDGTPPTFTVGLKYAFVLNGSAAWIASDAPYRSGNIRIASMDFSIGPKPGLKLKLSGTSQGAVVSVRP